MALEPEPEPAPVEASPSTKRLRWATQHKKGAAARSKRASIVDRWHHHAPLRHSASGRRHASAGDAPESQPQPALGGIEEEVDEASSADSPKAKENPTGQGPRSIYFNRPLPPSEVYDDGQPRQHYTRNKVRTAKYTPITFLPLNLWLQFHNIANIFFLVLIILTVRSRTRFPNIH